MDNGWQETVLLADPDGSGGFESPEYRWEYDSIGRVTKEFDPSGRFSESFYDARSRLTRFVNLDPDDAGPLLPTYMDYAYDDVGNLISTTDVLGHVNAFAYDDLDRVISMTLPDPDGSGPLTAPVYQTVYDSMGNTVLQTDDLGRETSISYDNLYRQKSVTLPDPDGPSGGLTSPVWAFSYNSDSLLSSVIDPLQNTTSRGYDNSGRLTSFTDKAGNTTTYSYDLVNRLESVTSPDPDGAGPLSSSVRSYTYDIQSRLSGITDANGNTTHFSHNKRDQLVSIEDGGANTTKYTYDAIGRMTSETDASGRSRGFTYNSVGRPVRTVDGNGRVTRFLRDGYTETEQWYEYDNAPNLSHGPYGHGTGIWNSNLNGSTTSVTFGNVTMFDPNADNFFRLHIEGKTTKWINTASSTVDIASAVAELDPAYDNLRVERFNNNGSDGLKFDFLFGTPDFTAEVYLGDDGNLVNEFILEKDEIGRLESVKDLDGSQNSSFDYSYTYDGLNRLTKQEEVIAGLNPVVTINRGYDKVGNMTSQSAKLDTADDYHNSYTFDQLDRLHIVQQESQLGGNAVSPKRVVQTYNALGQKTYVNRYENTGHVSGDPALRTVFQYDSSNRLGTMQHRKVTSATTSSLLHKYTFAYDNMSRYTSIDSTVDGESSFSYDSLSQLTEAHHAVTRPDEVYNYDANGNRTGSGYSTIANRISSDGVFYYSYDKEGNRVSKYELATGASEIYAWDHRNRLTSIEIKDAQGIVTSSTEYGYDVFNRLIRRTHDIDGAGPQSATDRFFAGFDENNPTLEFDGNLATDLIRRNLWEGGFLAAQEQVSSLVSGGEVYWPLSDQTGTIRDIGKMGSGGQFEIANHRVFDSFGNVTSQTNSNVQLEYAFTGRWHDSAVGLSFHWNRWFDPATGSWLSDDPIGFAAGDVNLQRYVGNSPLQFTDTNGLEERPVMLAELGNDQGTAVAHDELDQRDILSGGFVSRHDFERYIDSLPSDATVENVGYSFNVGGTSRYRQGIVVAIGNQKHVFLKYAGHNSRSGRRYPVVFRKATTYSSNVGNLAIDQELKSASLGKALNGSAAVLGVIVGQLPFGSLLDKLVNDEGTWGEVAIDSTLELVPFGIGKGLKYLPTAKVLSRFADNVASRGVVGSLDTVVNSASMRRMNIPNRIVQDTVDDYIARNLRMFEESGGTIIRNAGPAPTRVVDGVTYRTLGNMNYRTKTIRLYDGHEIQDVVEELGHFRQAVRDGYWGGSNRLPGDVRTLWEEQIDTLFGNLGFVPR